jgi:hypothetical protein
MPTCANLLWEIRLSEPPYHYKCNKRSRSISVFVTCKEWWRGISPCSRKVLRWSSNKEMLHSSLHFHRDNYEEVQDFEQRFANSRCTHKSHHVLLHRRWQVWLISKSNFWICIQPTECQYFKLWIYLKWVDLGSRGSVRIAQIVFVKELTFGAVNLLKIIWVPKWR